MNPIQKRFAADHGLPEIAVTRIVRIAKFAFEANEHACNGDPHPWQKNKADKNANADAWGVTLEGHTRDLLEVIRPYGFTDVVYTGLGPTLKKGEVFVEVPY